MVVNFTVEENYLAMELKVSAGLSCCRAKSTPKV
jgi:hypothetical protein